MDFLDEDAETTHRLWRINRTLMEVGDTVRQGYLTLRQMAKDRGYEVEDVDKDMTLEQFKDRYGSQPTVGQPSRSQLDKILTHAADGGT